MPLFLDHGDCIECGRPMASEYESSRATQPFDGLRSSEFQAASLTAQLG
jgi:hypothetical protein